MSGAYPECIDPFLGLMFHSLSLKASDLPTKNGLQSGPLLVAGRGRSPFRRPLIGSFFNPCITGRGPSCIGWIGVLQICFLISWRRFFRVPFFGAFGFSPLTKGTQDSEGYQTKRAEGRAVYSIFSQWHQPKLHATIFKKRGASTFDPTCCCWSFPTSLQKNGPI